MSVAARMKQTAGGVRIPTIASAATLVLPDDSNVIMVSGTTTVTSLNSGRVWPGRQVTFIGTDGSGNAFTNTNATTDAGKMDLGGSNVTLALDDVLVLVQMNTGAWRKVVSTDN